MNLDIWDWRYRISFLPEVFEKVATFSKKLERTEKGIFDTFIEFYREFSSFDMILNYLMESKWTSWSNTGIIKFEQLENKLLPISERLKNYYKNKCEECKKINLGLSDFIDELYNSASSKSPAVIDTEELFKEVTGKYFKEAKKIIDSSQPVEYQRNRVNMDKNHLVDELNEYINRVSNPEMEKFFGKNSVDDYDIEIKNDIGYAEWWNREALDRKKDKLILFVNDDSLNRDDFEYTIYHEIYPGHGHFYNYLRSNVGKYCDYGAIMLIEGWATYCEWAVKASDYSEILKSRGIQFLKTSFSNESSSNKIEKLCNSRIKSGYSESEALYTALHYDQYPGFLESYYMGALCIDVMVEEFFGTATGFLDYLKAKNKGDYFGLWG